MPPSVTTLVTSERTIDQDVMQSTLLVFAKRALRTGFVPPQFHHIRTFHRVDLRVKDKRDYFWTRTVDQVAPREVKRPNSVHTPCRTRHEEWLMRFSSSKSRSFRGFQQDLVGQVTLGTQATATSLPCKPQIVFDNGSEFC